MATVDDLLEFCRLHLSEGEAERLVGWIAWRTEHNQALAGSRPPIDRLSHALEHWVGADERRKLLSWLRRRERDGKPMVP